MVPEVSGLVEVRREMCIPDLAAARRYVGLCRPGLRVYAFETRSMVVESEVLGPRPLESLTRRPSRTAHVCVPLAGSYVVRRSGREHAIERGSMWLDADVVMDERWEGGVFRGLGVEWDARFGASLRTGDAPLSLRDVERFDRLAAEILAGEVRGASLMPVLEALGAQGLESREGIAASREPASALAHTMATSVSRLWSQLHTHPDLADLAVSVGVSARQIRRRLKALGEWSAVPHGDWRGALRTLRVRLAPSLATVPGMTVDRIAALLGYRSPQALLLALREERMPSPNAARAQTLGYAPA